MNVFLLFYVLGTDDCRSTLKEDGTVPYEELDDLPYSVKRNLPKHAREICRIA